MLVIGTGAVASFLLPRLATLGCPLQVYGSPSPRLEALAGLASEMGAVHSAAEVAEHDLWLVVCKAWQNRAKVEELRLAPRPRRILVLQNGLAPEQAWLELGQAERALMTYGVATVAPGQAVGGEKGEIDVPAGSIWGQLFLSSGLQVKERDDMTAAVWWKLVVNGSLNVVASLANLRNGEVLERARTRHWARLAASQVAQTARGLGIEISGRQAMERMEAVARATASNVCSTLADLKSGRPTEYGAINGAILQQASRLGLALDGLRELDRRFAMISTSGIVPAEAAL